MSALMVSPGHGKHRCHSVSATFAFHSPLNSSLALNPGLISKYMVVNKSQNPTSSGILLNTEGSSPAGADRVVMEGESASCSQAVPTPVLTASNDDNLMIL